MAYVRTYGMYDTVWYVSYHMISYHICTRVWYCIIHVRYDNHNSYMMMYMYHTVPPYDTAVVHMRMHDAMMRWCEQASMREWSTDYTHHHHLCDISCIQYPDTPPPPPKKQWQETTTTTHHTHKISRLRRAHQRPVVEAEATLPNCSAAGPQRLCCHSLR